jgi:aminoglycoside phosphotransferase (APT) family kinase protein
MALAGPAATVQGILPLAGGTHARTYLIRTAAPERELILREYAVGEDAVRREMRVLTALDGLGGLAPRLLAGHPDSQPPEGPWILISRLAGIADIIPGDPPAFAQQLGVALARIHAAGGHGLAGLPSVFDRPGGSPATLSGPAASLVAARWPELTSAQAVLTHYDYWSGNTVWERGVLTGVVDWSGGALGPRGFDLGWGRLDLYLLYGEPMADRFLESYQAASTVGWPDPLLYDLWAVARSHEIVESWDENYRDLGRADLTAQALRERHTAWTRQLVERAA